MSVRFVLGSISLVATLSLFDSASFAQRYTVINPKDRLDKRNVEQKVSRTDVEVIVLTQRGAGIQAQQWSRVFRKLGVALRVRQGRGTDTVGIQEKTIGTLRRVTLTGQLTARGTLEFAERSFTQRDSGKLKKWIDELKKYGAQGSPDGKKFWGLNEQQFEKVFKAFQKPLQTNVKNKNIREAIAAMKFPEEYRPRFSPEAERVLRAIDPDRLVIGKELKNFSLGTSLAILLRERELGVHPLRLPNGSVELVIDPLDKSKENWSVGWELSKFKLSRKRTAPKLFELIPVSLQDAPYENTLKAVEKKTEVPIILDRYAISLAGIDLEAIRITYEKKSTTWNLLVKGISSKNKMTSRLKVDDAGKPFLWIAPFVSRRIGK